MAAVAVLERNFPPHFEVRGGWFRFIGRLSKRTAVAKFKEVGIDIPTSKPSIIFKLEASIDPKSAKRRIRRLVKILSRSSYGIGTVIIWIVDPKKGLARRFVKTIENTRGGLKKLLGSFKEFLSTSIFQTTTVWDELETWGRVAPPSPRSQAAYTAREFNAVFNRMLLALRARDRALARLARWGKALRADIEARKDLLDQTLARIRQGWGRNRDFSLVTDLEEEIRVLEEELKRARAAYRRLLATAPEGLVRGNQVDWSSYKELRREWFKRLCSSPREGGLELPPSRIRGEEEVSASSLKAAEGLWGEEHQDSEGLRVHHLQDLVQP